MERTKGANTRQYKPGFLTNTAVQAETAGGAEALNGDPSFYEENKKGRELLHLNCRFYERRYPEVDELVMVNVLSIAEMGAYVSLLEFNSIEGMILLSELSRRRIRSINKLIRVGKTEVVTVLRVDKEKGYIDLSKSRVSSEDILKCEERYNKAKTVHAVLHQLAQQNNENLETYYETIGWPLYKKLPLENKLDNTQNNEKKTEYMHCYDIFKMALSDPTVLADLPISESLIKQLIEVIQRKLTPQPMKIRTDIEVTCFTYEGIDAIREALLAAECIGDDEVPIKVKLIAPPMYVMTTNTIAKTKGLEKLTQAIEMIKQKIEEKGGTLKVKMEPKVVSQNEEKELLMMLDRLEMESRLVDGDEDEENMNEKDA